MEVTVTRRYKGTTEKGGFLGYSYSTGQTAITVQQPANPVAGSTSTTYPQPAIYEFSNTDHPVINNFDTLFAPVYGRHPWFILIVYENALESNDSENELVQYIPPKINVAYDVIVSVEYDLSGLGNVSGKIIINGQNTSGIPYSGGNTPSPVVVNPPPYPEPAVFAFENTSLPTINDFDTLYVPRYGRNPRFTLVVYEGTDELVQYIPPKLTIVDNVITVVAYDLSGLGNVSGKIIINK